MRQYARDLGAPRPCLPWQPSDLCTGTSAASTALGTCCTTTIRPNLCTTEEWYGNLSPQRSRALHHSRQCSSARGPGRGAAASYDVGAHHVASGRSARNVDPFVNSESEAAGATLRAALDGCQEGRAVRFPRPVAVLGHRFTSAIVLRQFKTASRALLIQLHPGNYHFVLKFEDVRAEHALMCAFQQMNARWRQRQLTVFGEPVEVLTYMITPLGAHAGLIEVVNNSKTLRELSQGVAYGHRQLRAVRALEGEPRRLQRLAASTVGMLTAGYALGIRDGHDDNLMLRADGTLFRIDLGFAFGRTPEIDAPCVFVPNAVHHALGPQLWSQVVGLCGHALQALGSPEAAGFRQTPAWDLVKSVPELRPLLPQAEAYLRTLSFEDFGKRVRFADQWTLSRAAKNTLREAVRYVMAETDPEAPQTSRDSDERWFARFAPFSASVEPAQGIAGGAYPAVCSGVQTPAESNTARRTRALQPPL